MTKTANTKDLEKKMEEGESPIVPGMTINSLLKTDTIRKRFDDVLGKKAAGFTSSILSAVSMSKALETCDPMSIVAAAMIAATLDLAINPSLGFAHIVPYKGIATFQIGWKGIIQLAMRTGQYRTMNICTVYEGEITEHNKFTGLMEFDEDGKTSDNVAGYLLYFRLLNSYEKYVYMTAEGMKHHGKKYSQSFKQGKGVWVDNFEAMAHKTIAKLGLSKYGILSIEMNKAFVSDQAAIDKDGNPDYIDTDATPDVPFGTGPDVKEEKNKPL